MKKLVYCLLLVFTLIIGIIIGNNNNDKEIIVNSTNKNNSDTLSMMYETEFGKGEYIVSSSLNWPDSQSYSFNPRLSKCENGGTLSWDSTTNQVIMTGDKSDKCYVYFDIAPYHVTCSDNTLACQIAKTYTSDGVNNLYYHDGYGDYTNSDLEAGDYSYRYAGAYEDVNNYVCFGSSEATCPAENLYRIIGVFDDDLDGVYNVKLIMADYATSNMLGDYDSATSLNDWGEEIPSTYRGILTSIDVYYWNSQNYDMIDTSTGAGRWSTSILNINGLNSNYLDNYLGSTWSNKIDNHTWILGGDSRTNIEQTNAKQAYLYEFDTSDPIYETYFSKVALMYVSDYYYAADSIYWSYPGLLQNGNDYGNSVNANWLVLGGCNEATLSVPSPWIGRVFGLTASGKIGGGSVVWGNYFAIRPTFYLNSNVTLTSGTGTLDSPYRLN